MESVPTRFRGRFRHSSVAKLCGITGGLCLYVLTSLTTQAAVVINEIHYNPDVKTDLVEFVELHNPGPADESLDGWSLTDGILFTFPAGTKLAAGGYVVIAENPAALQNKFGVQALGPWIGKLENEGEKIVLRNQAGQIVDEVQYELGFPWPTVGDPPGNSIELVNPALDNDLGGSWRAAGGSSATDASNQDLIPARSDWRYFKGKSEASTPASAWRVLSFDDSAWPSGPAPIGYGEDILATRLTDMQGGYTSVFFRKKFQIGNPSEVNGLQLEALLNDGFNIWINGQAVLSRNMPGPEVPYNGTAVLPLESLQYETFTLPPPGGYLLAGENVISIQAHNVSLANSSDFFIDVRLVGLRTSTGRRPPPGGRNSVHADHIPPLIRQVNHEPTQPAANQPVKIMAKITDPDGVAAVTLLYQLVDPGRYIELTDREYQTNWTSVVMNDAGQAGDVVAGDTYFTVELPPTLQTHRRLVRYRITATDAGGRSVTVPYADDPQPNFAYFVYDGVPPWTGAIEPNSADQVRSARVIYGTNVMRRLPVYHLLAKATTVEEAQYGGYTGDQYRWLGTLVYDEEVYDHVRHRARGGVWRYSMGKNMWKFDFNRGHTFQARDNFGKKYRTTWTKLNLGACIQQADYLHRGEQGMFESVGFRLFNMAGVEAPKTHFVQFRVIDDAVEAHPSDQYQGDLWGLYLVTEQPDGRFLEEHGLPDGNFYKMENYTGELNNQGATAASDKSDLNPFISGYRNSGATDEWWRQNLDLARYYSYQAIVQGIHHYDICEGKNYFYFLNPETKLWSVHPWDIDLTWADNMYKDSCGGIDEFKNRIANRPALNLEFKNRVREIRDLLVNTDQAYQLIDEYAAMIDDPNGGPSFVDVDRTLWDYNPILVSSKVLSYKAGHGRFYQIAPMKDYLVKRAVLLDNAASDALIPAAPTITYAGPAGYAANRLSFPASNYGGANPFAAVKWRVGEITPPGRPSFDPNQPRKYEIETAWESAEITNLESEMRFPSHAVEVGHTYRTRAKVKDSAGRWSHWSDAIQFVAGAPDNTTALVENLRITELMYHPPDGSEFEFIELHNIHPSVTLDLSGVTFARGVDFTFPSGAILLPGGYALVVAAGTNNFGTFRTKYKLDATVPVFGPYFGSLANEGERFTIQAAGGGADLIDFTYDDSGAWPQGTDGAGYSLVPLESTLARQDASTLNDPKDWRASRVIGGSPGGPELPVTNSDSDADGLPDDWEIAHGFDPRSNRDAGEDADADGLTNLQEYTSGTNPRDPQSGLKLTAAEVKDGRLLIRFAAAAGKSYTVQFKHTVSDSAWQKLLDIEAGANGRLMEVPAAIPTTATTRFYRVVTPGVP